MKNKFFLFALMFVGILQAQDKKQSYSYTLKEAIEHAIQNNYSAINANRDVEAAKKKKWETTTMGLPQINGSVGYQDNFKLQKSLIPAEFFGGAPGTFVPVTFGTKHNMNSAVTLSQLIFDGSYLVGLQSAKTYLKISENAKIKTAQEIKEIVINSYGNVLLAEESISILQKNKGILEKTLSDTREIYKNGLIEEENVEQLQITLASVTSALENVKRQRIIANDMLKLLLGMDLSNELKLTDKLEALTTTNVDLNLLKEEFNVTNNIDYQIGQNVKTSKELLLKLEKSKALPSLGAAVNFGYNAFGNDFKFFTPSQQWFNYSNLGISLNVPLFSSLGRSARTQQAKIALEQSRTQLTETEQKLKLQFEKAKSDYEFSIEQLATSKSNLSLAERIENKNQIKFKEGLSSSFDLTKAQEQLYSAQQSYLQAMVDVINKKASLEKLLNKN
ncbi:TolC family protein [Flavobacterium aciduliphilum]|uniref:Outer membrane protein TolC n=1 Tax=Flavobacterium aciduliphilum TaxID=1101402 RepID=A0A328YJ30_9FLAO|nr:TolC family protein [Flavobacterium aciduliphilum]RAR72765.1 outer membrane protein TolC [Flavobacterium aciduliphilum]